MKGCKICKGKHRTKDHKYFQKLKELEEYGKRKEIKGEEK